MNLWPLLILIVVLAFATGSDSLFYLAYVLGGLLLLTLVWLRQAPAALRTERRFPARAFHGEEIAAEVILTNRSRWPLVWLRVHESLPLSLHSPNFVRRVVSLAPGETTTLRYHLKCQRRGYYQIGPLLLRTGDVLSLLPDREIEGGAENLIVYPRVVPLREIGLPSRLPYGDVPSQQRIFEDPSRFFGVREYQPGDSLRQINWKSSARTDQLLVKRFQPAIALNTLLVLNLNADEYSVRGRVAAGEMGVVVAASLAAHMSERRQRVGLAVSGKDAVTGRMGLEVIPSGRGRGQLMRILETLARAELGSTVTVIEVLDRATTQLGWGSSVVVITPGESAQMISALLQLRRRGFHVVLVATDPQAPFRGFKARLEQIGVPAYWVTEDKDLDSWR